MIQSQDVLKQTIESNRWFKGKLAQLHVNQKGNHQVRMENSSNALCWWRKMTFLDFRLSSVKKQKQNKDNGVSARPVSCLVSKRWRVQKPEFQTRFPSKWNHVLGGLEMFLAKDLQPRVTSSKDINGVRTNSLPATHCRSWDPGLAIENIVTLIKV